MPNFDFHPAVTDWFTRRFGMPTQPQEMGWPAIQAGEHTLIAAPTGSGKTLAAFLAALDHLVREAERGALEPKTKVVYVSPLKALSNDIHHNLAEPLEGIQASMRSLGREPVEIRTAVRTGDTSASGRRAIVKKPPHILVTTPESLYLMLTSESGRGVLADVETLIVDEIHALADNRRGTHLSLSMERLQALTGRPLQRIGLSATQRPMTRVAQFLLGNQGKHADGAPPCRIIDEGHLKALDLRLELPDSPLEAVMSHEVWQELYQRLVQLIQGHETTLIFVNTRRLAERITYHLMAELGSERVASHHGSLSVERRQHAETELKGGRLKALVATASLELGIDIGAVNLVCQIGSPRSISALVQRVGRSGHQFGGVPKGRLFPLTRDELIECLALLWSVKQRRLDMLEIPRQPLDVLAQQIVAAAACEDWPETELYRLCKRAYPYRDLEKDTFLRVVHMLADGISTRRGRRGAHIYYDGVNHIIKGRKGARLVALSNGGAIPDNADYQVVLEPEGTFIGTLNEDFAIESLAGDIFQLGNHSWRILRVESGKVRVEDAEGMPPTIPFWIAEAPGRTDELSRVVSEFRARVDREMDGPQGLSTFLNQEFQLEEAGIRQLEEYLGAAKKALGALPTQEHIILERFFDEAGGMQLVIHAPFGSRLNRAWGLALRKRFCRSFNFELQAAAGENAIVLSLGPKHAFPLEDVFEFLNAASARDVLVQALLDAPMFQTRWRWNASRSLALVRQRGGKRIPPPIQRMEAEDLIAVVFPDQLACLENIVGEREIPDHPLVQQTIDDCLHEAMDLDGLIRLLKDLESGAIRRTALDLPEPSPLSHEILNAQPYAFLDDAPLEERRTRAVLLRRTLSPDSVQENGLLDVAAIDTVCEQAWPAAEDRDQVHEALLFLGALDEQQALQQEPQALWANALVQLADQGRVGLMRPPAQSRPRALYIVAERVRQWRLVFPTASLDPPIEPPPREKLQSWTAESARIDILRGRMEVCGPVTVSKLAQELAFSQSETEAGLLALENEGMVLRGRFDPRQSEEQWCNRRLLARIHNLTLQRLRSQIKPVSTRDFMRFLFQWQRVEPGHRGHELEGLEAVIGQLEGYEAAAGAWEKDILRVRLERYSPAWLDQLCLMGKVRWGRQRPPIATKTGAFAAGPLKSSPISLFFRENLPYWNQDPPNRDAVSSYGRQILEVLEMRGASFFTELCEASSLLPTQTEMALGELVALGFVSADSFAGLRALLLPSHRKPIPTRARTRHTRSRGVEFAGRWSILAPAPARETDGERQEGNDEDRLTYLARVLLRRYGVVFRQLARREAMSPPWRDLLYTFRRLEAIGEIRGGRFVERFGGEQFALPEAIGLLRKVRNQPPGGSLVNLAGCDPLNLTGALLPGPTIAQTAANRILFRDGKPIAAMEGGKVISLSPEELISPNMFQPKPHEGAPHLTPTLP